MRAANLASRTLGGEEIIMNPADSALFSLNETATAIWLAADGRTTLREIVAGRICADYEVDFDEAMRDAEKLVRGLAEHSILLLLPEPVEAAE
jgi:hypothetical protein